MAEPLTFAQVLAALNALAERKPETLNWPVHILDMGTVGGEDDPDEKLGGLVTEVGTDMYSEEQGRVVDLVAWHSLEVKGGKPMS